MGFRRTGPRLLALATALLIAGACSRSGYQFLRNPNTGTYLKVPSDWKVFDQAEVGAAVQPDGTSPEEFKARTPFVSMFDSQASGKVRAFDPTGNHPMGIVLVTALSAAERDTVSLATLRGQMLPDFDTLIASGQLEVVKLDEITEPNVRGQHLTFRLKTLAGELVVVDQTTLVNHTTSRSYLLAVGCTAACYEENKASIAEVVSSLTIKEK
jgi:hypothetical protein